MTGCERIIGVGGTIQNSFTNPSTSSDKTETATAFLAQMIGDTPPNVVLSIICILSQTTLGAEWSR